ncbi:nucleotidyltransferase domain-containing protein [Candidatus Woesearchaeota archaeon]|nr:nucleotidyltransferase domain-containing protein [Candidatus Woesearchaeota archaeon]
MIRKDSAIVKFLMEQKNEELNIRTISERIKMDYKTVYSIIKRLEKMSVVKIELFGRSKRVILNNTIHPSIFEAEFERKNDVLKDKNLAVMLSNFRRGLRSKMYILLLFGSYAKRTQTKNSDIDLLFICPNGSGQVFEKDVHRISQSMHLPLHTLVFSESQFIEMIHSRESNVGQEVLNNNVILYGVEQYYEMI